MGVNFIGGGSVAAAIGLFNSPASVEEGISLLKEAAVEGSDEANYQLGSLYMQGVVTQADNDKALEYLERVRGENQIAASILIGVIYATGSKKIKPDKDAAKKIFDNAAKNLDAEIETHTVAPGTLTTKKEMDNTKILFRAYQDWTLLKGYSDEYGITLEIQ
jgi:TPR repeat protein